MPELPEVETVCQGLKPYLVGSTIEKVTIRQPSLRWPIPVDLPELLANQAVKSIGRRGKYVLVQMPKGTLIIHLGMSGSLRIVDDNSLPSRHDHVDFHLNQNIRLRYNDPRRFGSMHWTIDDPLSHPLIKTIGIEPLESGFNGGYLLNKASGRKTAIKSFIMNAQVVAGVGNIYATEALFLAKVHPLKAAGALSRVDYQALAEAIKKILAEAIRAGGTTLKDFVNSEGNPGYFSQKLYVYGRSGQACLLCEGQIESVKLGQRTTAFCSSCQLA